MSESVALKISGKEFRNWDQLEIVLGLDSYSTAAFTAPMEPDRAEFRSTFVPFSFASVSISADDDDIFDGVQVNLDPVTTPEGRKIKLEAYAKPGVFQDCTLPASAFPIEFNGLTLKQIAEKCGSHFGVSVASLPMLFKDAPFTRVACKPDTKVQEFLSDLAKQRNLVLSNTADGKLEFIQPSSFGVPAEIFEEGVQPCEQVESQFSPQDYYSEITGLGSSKIGGKGSKNTEKNPHLSGVTRPLTFKVDSTESASMGQATKSHLGRMFGNMVSYTITAPTWRARSGQLWRPNQMISLKAPGVMVYKPTLMTIRTVTLAQSKDEEMAKLNVVLPGSFSGEVPKVLPWLG